MKFPNLVVSFVVVCHLIWAVFIVLGTAIYFTPLWSSIGLVHYAMVTMTIAGWMVFKSCLLTKLEVWLQQRYTTDGMEKWVSFLSHNLKRYLGISLSTNNIRLTAALIWLLGSFMIFFVH